MCTLASFKACCVSPMLGIILWHVWEYEIQDMLQVLFIKTIVLKGSGDLVGT